MSQLDELREILNGDNSERLSELKTRLEDIELRTKDVAEVLAPAIDKGIQDSDDLINALKEPVSEGLKQTIRAEPVEYAEILYPAIAPSIRLAISQAISSLLATINQTMASATTISGLRTRIESARTGVPYAELVLRKSLIFRVEHVYLIDRDTGLMIAEVANNENSAMDSDAVSAMFSAIQSFVQDSFSGNEADRLTDFKVGDHNIWIAHGPRAMLACVIRGDAPESLKLQLYNSLDNIRAKYAQQIAAFDGDSSSFVGVEEHLRPLLQLRLKDDAGETQQQTSLVTKLVLFAIVFGLIFMLVKWFDQRSKLASVEHYFARTPGFMVTDLQWQSGKIVIDGLKDPDASLPINVLKTYGIDADQLDLQTKPFRSLEHELELRRFSNEFEFPRRVTIVSENNELAVRGAAPLAWLLKNESRLRQLVADKRLSVDELSIAADSLPRYFSAKTPQLPDALIDQLSKRILATPWKDLNTGIIDAAIFSYNASNNSPVAPSADPSSAANNETALSVGSAADAAAK